MRIIIDIPEEDINFLKDTYKATGYSYLPSHIVNTFAMAIAKGKTIEAFFEEKWREFEKKENKQ